MSTSLTVNLSPGRASVRRAAVFAMLWFGFPAQAMAVPGDTLAPLLAMSQETCITMQAEAPAIVFARKEGKGGGAGNSGKARHGDDSKDKKNSKGKDRDDEQEKKKRKGKKNDDRDHDSGKNGKNGEKDKKDKKDKKEKKNKKDKDRDEEEEQKDRKRKKDGDRDDDSGKKGTNDRKDRKDKKDRKDGKQNKDKDKDEDKNDTDGAGARHQGEQDDDAGEHGHDRNERHEHHHGSSDDRHDHETEEQRHDHGTDDEPDEPGAGQDEQDAPQDPGEPQEQPEPEQEPQEQPEAEQEPQEQPEPEQEPQEPQEPDEAQEPEEEPRDPQESQEPGEPAEEPQPDDTSPSQEPVPAVVPGVVTLNWAPPTENEDGSPLVDLAGYRVYWRDVSGDGMESLQIDNPGLSTIVIEGLDGGTYEFEMTSFDVDGIESVRSNTITRVVASSADGGDGTGGPSTGSAGDDPAPYLVISGTPPEAVIAGELYLFTPMLESNTDSQPAFSIEGMPYWAGFDVATGELYGTPGEADIGLYTAITIAATNGTVETSLPTFSIEVVAPGAAPGAVTLSWMPPTENEDGSYLVDLAGYWLYWGNNPGQYTQWMRIDNPGLTTIVIDDLVPGSWEFAMTSFNAAGIESSLSNAVTLFVE